MRVQDILHLPVYTKSGDHLGKVTDVNIDPDDLRIVQLIVKSGVALPIVSDEYVIHRQQVIAVSEDKIIVDDAAAKSAEMAASARPV